jgi:hypothetical protein
MLDTAFSMLSNAYRRRILLALRTAKLGSAGAITIPEDVHRGEIAIERLRSKLRHVHLPKLERAGYVSHDPATDQVVQGPAYDDIEAMLEAVATVEDDLPDTLE